MNPRGRPGHRSLGGGKRLRFSSSHRGAASSLRSPSAPRPRHGRRVNNVELVLSTKRRAEADRVRNDQPRQRSLTLVGGRDSPHMSAPGTAPSACRSGTFATLGRVSCKSLALPRVFGYVVAGSLAHRRPAKLAGELACCRVNSRRFVAVECHPGRRERRTCVARRRYDFVFAEISGAAGNASRSTTLPSLMTVLMRR